SAILNRSRTSGDVTNEWNDVVDVLNRMKRLLSGYDVDLPPAYGNTEVVTPGVPPPAPVPYLTGADLSRFRDLVRDLDNSLARVRDAADRYGRRGYEGAQEVFTNLQFLADETSRLRQRSEADRLDPRDLRPSVERLADTARRTDESIRRHDMLPGVRNE